MSVLEMSLPESKLVKEQVKIYGPKSYTVGKERYTIKAEVRYDDECGNGHNSFAITGEIRCNGREYAFGCLHEEIAKHFPRLAPYIKWHLFDATGPMHYLANTIYNAGDRDCWGLRKGEFRQHTSRGKYQNDGVEGVPQWFIYTPDGTKKEVYSHTKPGPDWLPVGMTGEGKERQLDFARSTAVWPEATDEQLCAEPEQLKAMLLERLPALVAEFKKAVESLGFEY